MPDAIPHAGAVTLTEQAYRAIEEALATLQFEPGAVVSETQIAERVGFGRTPVREALQRLARERLVHILPRRGILVAPIDPAEQLRLLTVRRELERLIARLAAAQSDDAQRETFRRIAEGMERVAETADDTTYLRVDRALNLLVLEAARNEYAAAAMALLHGLSRRFWYLHGRHSGGLAESALAHARLARAIAAGEEAEAAAASDALMDTIEHFTRATLG
jgi:DNA-binding GntR family transcriptional regulator